MSIFEFFLFLDDLFNRISIEEIHIPSLIDRKEDIPPLVRYFIDDYASTTEILHNLSITEDALAILQSYSWPGNIKELRNRLIRHGAPKRSALRRGNARDAPFSTFYLL
mgnify:CR=1 FL=1